MPLFKEVIVPMLCKLFQNIEEHFLIYFMRLILSLIQEGNYRLIFLMKMDPKTILRRH